MNFVCKSCGDSVDELGFKVQPSDSDESVQPVNCIDCRVKTMNVKFQSEILERLQSLKSYNLPYKDEWKYEWNNDIEFRYFGL